MTATLALDSPVGTLVLEGSDDALTRLTLPASDDSLARRTLRGRDDALTRLTLPASDDFLARRTVRGRAALASHAERPPAAVAEAARQLDEYFDGRRRAFDVPIALAGTPFQRAVWAALAEIPYGHTITYAELAARVGRPRACRAAGAANGANPIPIVLPCHRVVATGGGLGGYGGGLEMKRTLLALEGLTRPALF